MRSTRTRTCTRTCIRTRNAPTAAKCAFSRLVRLLGPCLALSVGIEVDTETLHRSVSLMHGGGKPTYRLVDSSAYSPVNFLLHQEQPGNSRTPLGFDEAPFLVPSEWEKDNPAYETRIAPSLPTAAMAESNDAQKAASSTGGQHNWHKPEEVSEKETGLLPNVFGERVRSDSKLLPLFQDMTFEDARQRIKPFESRDSDLLNFLRNTHPEMVAQYEQMVAEVTAKAKVLDTMENYLRQERIRVAKQCPVPKATTLAEVSELRSRLALCEHPDPVSKPNGGDGGAPKTAAPLSSEIARQLNGPDSKLLGDVGRILH